MVLGSSPVAVTSPPDFAPASSKEFLGIQATIECGFTLKRVCDITRTYSQFGAQFMKKFSNPEAELKKKALLIKKRVFVYKRRAVKNAISGIFQILLFR